MEDTIDVRDKHGAPYYIRRFQKDSEELALLTECSSMRMRAEEWNRVVPILETFDDPDDPSTVFVVTELLHSAKTPVWTMSNELMDFGEQILGVCRSLLIALYGDSDILYLGFNVLSFAWDH